jgi:hypothetical protein
MNASILYGIDRVMVHHGHMPCIHFAVDWTPGLANYIKRYSMFCPFPDPDTNWQWQTPLTVRVE